MCPIILTEVNYEKLSRLLDMETVKKNYSLITKQKHMLINNYTAKTRCAGLTKAHFFMALKPKGTLHNS